MIDYSRLMEDFCDTVLRENSSRAIREKAPLSFRQCKDRWRDCMECSDLGSKAGKSDKLEKKEEYKRDGFNKGGRGGASKGGPDSSRGRGVTFQGHPVCYHYNNKAGCNRKAHKTIPDG